MLQQAAELSGGGDAQVHADPCVGARPGARCARGGDALDLLELSEPRDERGWVARLGDHVDVLDAVASAPDRPRELDARALRGALHQAREQRLAELERAGQQYPAG